MASYKKNAHGLKNSVNKYRNINGVYYTSWAINRNEFDQEIATAKDKNLKTIIINNELYREVK